MSLFYSAEQTYSAGGLQQGQLTLIRKVSGRAFVYAHYEGPVLTCFVSTAGDRSNSITILTVRELD